MNLGDAQRGFAGLYRSAQLTAFRTTVGVVLGRDMIRAAWQTGQLGQRMRKAWSESRPAWYSHSISYGLVAGQQGLAHTVFRVAPCFGRGDSPHLFNRGQGPALPLRAGHRPLASWYPLGRGLQRCLFMHEHGGTTMGPQQYGRLQTGGILARVNFGSASHGSHGIPGQQGQG